MSTLAETERVHQYPYPLLTFPPPLAVGKDSVITSIQWNVSGSDMWPCDLKQRERQHGSTEELSLHEELSRRN